MKYTTETFEVAGARVDLTRVPVRLAHYSFRNDADGQPIYHPQEQALYEIWVDGQHVGMAARPHGFGRQSFHFERLGKAFSTWQLGDLIVYPKGYLPDADRLYSLDQVAQKAAELRTERRWGSLFVLMTLPALEKHISSERAREKRAEREAQARRQQWDRERAEQERRMQEARRDVAEGLRSINERLRAQLTNFESSALEEAIASFK